MNATAKTMVRGTKWATLVVCIAASVLFTCSKAGQDTSTSVDAPVGTSVAVEPKGRMAPAPPAPEAESRPRTRGIAPGYQGGARSPRSIDLGDPWEGQSGAAASA